MRQFSVIRLNIAVVYTVRRLSDLLSDLAFIVDILNAPARSNPLFDVFFYQANNFKIFAVAPFVVFFFLPLTVFIIDYALPRCIKALVIIGNERNNLAINLQVFSFHNLLL